MYKDIIYKPSTIDELIDSQLIAFKNGWVEYPTPIFKSHITEYIIFSIHNDRKLIFSLSRNSFSTEECLKHCLKFNGGDYVYFDNFIEFSKYMSNNKRQINYNEPRKLVYESIDNKEDIIILPINDEYDFLNIKNMILKSGNVFEYPDYNEYTCKYQSFTFRPKKKIFYMCVSDFGKIYKWYESSNDHNIIKIDSPNKLLFYLNDGKVINYNEPRKLVYESKILKYNEFKKC